VARSERGAGWRSRGAGAIESGVASGATLTTSRNSPAGPSPRHFWANRPATHFTAGAGAARSERGEVQCGQSPGAGASQHAGAGSGSEQHDRFFAGRATRDSTSGRTCAGGSIPLASAQRSFSSKVKQQQSPFQHSSALAHAHGRDWHG
jgi:hypothetical protein